MALDQLIATLEHEAQAEAEELLAAARAEAAALLASAEEGAAQRRREATGNWESRVNAQVAEGLLEERRAARRMLLESRHRLVGQVVDAARPLLAGMLGSDQYRTRLAAWTAQAFECIGARTARVLCHPSLVGDLTRLAAGHPNATVVAHPSVGAGFRVVTEGDALQVDCTLEGRLEALLPVLSMEVLEKFERDA